MWLLTVVGEILGQKHYTFALQQQKSYTFGRNKDCDIAFPSNLRIKPEEGTLEILEWDYTNRHSRPDIKWRPKPSKRGGYGSIIAVGKRSEAPTGSLNKGDYDVIPINNEKGSGVFVDEVNVTGISFADDIWFFLEWRDLCLLYGKMMDEPDPIRNILKSYCISWTTTFDTSDPPQYVLLDAYRNNWEARYAVCCGIPILLPSFLTLLQSRLTINWRKTADAFCSFKLPLPGENEAEYRPKNHQSIRFPSSIWLPDRHRRTLYRGWHVLLLREQIQPREAFMYKALGADLKEVIVEGNPPKTSSDVEEYLADWLSYVDTHWGRKKGLVAYSGKVKDMANAKMIEETCERLKVNCASVASAFGAVLNGGVEQFLEGVDSKHNKHATRVGSTTAVTLAASSSVPSPSADPFRRLTETPTPALTPTPPSEPIVTSAVAESGNVLGVPSTFSDETAPPVPFEPPRLSRRRTAYTKPIIADATPVPFASSEPQHVTVNPAGTEEAVDEWRPPPVAVLRRPQRRTVGKGARNSPTSASSQPLAIHQLNAADAHVISHDPHPSFAPNSMPSQEEDSPKVASGHSRTGSSDFPSSTQLNTVPPIQTLPRPSRRYGTTTSITRPQAASSRVSFEEPVEEDDRLEKLYEKTRKQGFGPASPAKKVRTADRGGDVEMEDTQRSSAAFMMDRERYKAPSEILCIDEEPEEEEEEQDLFAQTMRRSKRPAASAVGLSATQGTASQLWSRDTDGRVSQDLMPPPAQRRRIQSPPPSPEPGPSEGLAPRRVAPSQNRFDFQDAIPQPMTRDEQFLRVVAEHKKAKAAIDDLDKSFDSMLRIPKAQTQSEADKPDYSVLDEVPPPKAGNYIAVMRTNSLFRKDLGQKKERENSEDGRPNFKKFKKKNVPRRAPLKMVLTTSVVDPSKYEEPEPYWPTQKKTQKKSQTQSGSLSDPEEDDRPLLPKHKPRLLVEDDNEDDGNMEFMATGQTAAGRRGTQRNQVGDNRITLGTSTQRPRRGESIASDMYDNQPARSGTSKAANSKAATKATAAKGRNKLLIEDNDTTIDRGSAPSTTKGGKNSFESSGTATLDDDRSSTARKSTQKRKALTVNVDDDEDGFGNFGKRRRR
ncbi:hypothetical protein C367_00434 [Cryptococcus neoformans Ze90-1]|nr:hypothetical protein C367_00434 [Cryptococcus neoformans var. grubii Ze90-1]